jgi:hypothetical protein
MESQEGNSCFSVLKGAKPFIFVIDCDDSHGMDPGASPGNGRRSIVVRIGPEDIPFSLSATEPERATVTFAEALAHQIALLAIEKDFPNGVILSVSAKRIDNIPTEFENRPPSLCMNGNYAWLVYPRKDETEYLDMSSL